MILCCGEALIDMIPRQLPSGEDVFLPVAGGAIFNTALALGRLEAASGFFSPISEDLFGAQLIDTLNAAGVDTSLCPRSSQPTTLAFVKLENGHAKYSFFDENSALRSLTDDQLPRLPDNVAALHFGAISLIPKQSGGAFEALMMDNTDRVLSLDPNIRPGFIDDPDAHRARLSRMIAVADIVKVSDEDIDWMAQGGDPAALIETWLAGPTRLVLVTRGAEGVDAHTADETRHFPASKVEVVDTIGAGDTFNAGLLAGLAQTNLLDKKALASASLEALSPAIDLALRTAAVTVTRAGANPPTRAELE